MNTLRTCFLCLTLFAAASCTQDPLDPQTIADQEREALVGVSLRAVPESNGMPSSRSITDDIDEGTDSNYKVKDFWLLEYNDQGLMIGVPRYYQMEEGSDNVSVPVILPPVGSEYKCVVIANTHTGTFGTILRNATTLEKLKVICKDIRTTEDLYNAGTNDLLMNGVVPVTSSTSALDCQLYRNVAKLTLRLTNNEGSDVKINSVQLRNVPDRQFYADRLYADASAPSPTAAEAGFIDWEVEDCQIAAGDPTKTLVFYLPRNCRGETGSMLESQKNVGAPDYATFLEILAEDAARQTPLRYRFYLGQNMTNDFNIIPNRHYVLPITILDRGDALTDNRVEDMSVVELAESNSYLINPLDGDVQTCYSVPVTRINKFWGSSDGQIKEGDNTLLASTEWVAEVIWQDQPQRLINFCSEDGSVADDNVEYSGMGESFFYFKPIAGASGNVVIGVRKKTAGKDEYLWSWHLWLTDYTPERTTAWREGVYSYEVKGGHVHRYAGSSDGTNIWDTEYANKYIMDRNLGASSASDSDYAGSCGFYYQFGRKDPFPYSSTTLYDIAGNPQSTFTATNGDCIQRISGTAYFYMAVNHPYGFYAPGSNDWVRDNNPYVSRLWNNPTWHSDMDKSFFDPCPPGWRLPKADTWGVFSSIFGSNGTPNAKDNFNRGWNFYMGGPDTGETAWYPASGFRRVASGIMIYVGSSGNYWSALPYNASHGYLLSFTLSSAGPEGFTQRGNGFPVRCVQE